MASALTQRHIEGLKRLRVLAGHGVTQVWRSLPGYDRENVDEWLSRVVPIVLMAQQQAVAITDAYLAVALDRPPLGVDAENLVGAAVRNGTSPETVYHRPFVTLWSDLGAGKQFDEASSAALARAKSSAAMDTQLSMRATAEAVGKADEGIFGYKRVADAGACEFCLLVDGAYVKSGAAMALHNHCGCGLEPLTAPHPRAAKLPSGVAIHQHGELGPMLTAPDQHFTTEAQALG